MAAALAGETLCAGGRFCAWRPFFAPRSATAGVGEAAPPLTIFKPLNGAEPGLPDNLASFCRQDYAGPVQMVLGVQSPDDPAITIVNELKAAPFCRCRYPALVVETKAAPTVNPKIANLINMLPLAKHGILVMSDADIEVAPDYLRKVVAALERDNTGAVTCCYRGEVERPILVESRGDGDRSSVLARACVLGVATGLASPCFGQTIAMQRATVWTRSAALPPSARCWRRISPSGGPSAPWA